jgi:hypothetical protein
MNKSIIGAVALGLAVLTITFVAIAWSFESSDEAKADFCDSVATLSSTVESYQGLDPRTATAEELDAAEDAISDDWHEVVDDAEDWVNAYDNPLYEAYDALYWEVQTIPDDYTVAESLAEVEDELAAFPAAFDEAFDGSGCDTV